MHRERLRSRAPERVHEYLVVLHRHGANRAVQLEGSLLEHRGVPVVHAGALGKDEQRKLPVAVVHPLLDRLRNFLPVLGVLPVEVDASEAIHDVSLHKPEPTWVLLHHGRERRYLGQDKPVDHARVVADPHAPLAGHRTGAVARDDRRPARHPADADAAHDELLEARLEGALRQQQPRQEEDDVEGEEGRQEEGQADRKQHHVAHDETCQPQGKEVEVEVPHRRRRLVEALGEAVVDDGRHTVLERGRDVQHLAQQARARLLPQALLLLPPQLPL
mmetsp:Transcript_28354/g.59828  ORF Transcript_28354/g.59828 Transcript_28354/m.59828 type:complete len:275 (-) Transcript_28354:211-1035(-)